MTDPSHFSRSPSEKSSNSSGEGKHSENLFTAESIRESGNSKKRKKSGKTCFSVDVEERLLTSPLSSPPLSTRKRRISDSEKKIEDQISETLSRSDDFSQSQRVPACENGTEDDDEDIAVRLRIPAECYGECKMDTECCDDNHASVEDYIRSQNILNHEANFQAVLHYTNFNRQPIENLIQNQALPAMDDFSEDQVVSHRILTPDEDGNHYQLDQRHYMENIAQRFIPFNVVQSAVDCLEENLIIESTAPQFSIPPHFAQEERDVPIFKGNLSWVRIYDETQNDILWERLLLEMDDPRAHSSFTPSDTKRYYDGDFGWKMKVPLLSTGVSEDGYTICRRSPKLYPIFVLRRKITLLEDGFTLSMQTPTFAPPESPASTPASTPERINWKPCENDSEFLFGFTFGKSNFEIDLRKESVYYEESYHNPITQEKINRIIERVVLVANIYNPATTLSKKLIFDCFENLKESNYKGQLLQATAYGEVYKGLEYEIATSPDTLRNTIATQRDVVIKVVRCQSSGNSTAILKHGFRQTRNENILREIEAMDYLKQMYQTSFGQSRANVVTDQPEMTPFISFRNLLKDPNNLYVFSDFYEHGCLFDYLRNCRDFNRLDEKEAKLVIREIAKALLFMHKYGMAHQDLSTENILLQLPPTTTSASSLSSMKRANEIISSKTSDSSSSLPTTENNNNDDDDDSFLETKSIPFENFSFLLIDFGQVVGHQFDEFAGQFRTLPGRAFCVGKTIYHCPELFLNNKNHDVYRRTNFQSAVTLDYNGLCVDSWQLGILLYVLLTGQPPWNYHSADDHRLKVEWLESIRDDKLYDHQVYWSSHHKPGEIKYLGTCISKPAFDLMYNLLKFNPADRLTMNQVLNHPWLQD